MRGWMYILKCADQSYYTGSTNNLKLRLQQHEAGLGARHTKTRLPVKLVYYEEYERIDDAFYRERQIHGWSRWKKEALINGNAALLPKLAISYKRRGFDGAQPPCFDGAQPPCFDEAQSPDFDEAQSTDFDPSIDLGIDGSTN